MIIKLYGFGSVDWCQNWEWQELRQLMWPATHVTATLKGQQNR